MENIILSNYTLQDWQNAINNSVNNALQNHFKTAAPGPQAEKYLTRKETSKLLNVSLPTLNEYTKKGKLNACRFGVRVLYKLTEIEATLKLTSTGRAAHV